MLYIKIMYDKKTPQNEKSQQDFSRLEDLSKLTGELAHELKNPLSSIKVNLKLIGEELESIASQGQQAGYSLTRAQRKLSVVTQETERLERILDGFLRYVGKGRLSLGEVDINELIGDMVDFYMPQAQSRSVTIRHFLSKEPLVCKADFAMLKQVVLNLFINAQQAMPQGGELMVRTQKSGSNAQMQISDTGCGIEPEKLKKLFTPFVSSKTNGSGLGLAMVKRIIDQHNGSIAVASEQDKGTSFTIEIPLKQNV